MKKAPLLLGLLASCAVVETPARERKATTELAVFESTSVKRDEFRKADVFDAQMSGEDRGEGDAARWFLRAVRSTEVAKIVVFSLHFYRYSADWCAYDSAWADSGKALKLARLDSDVVTWNHVRALCRDYYSVSLTRDDLVRAAREGMWIKITGRRGDWVFGIPAYYAAGFLARVDGARPAAPAK